MRHLALVVLLGGCPAGGTSFPTNVPVNPAAGCQTAGTEYVAASAGIFQAQVFLVDGTGTLISQDVQTCVRSDGGGAAWMLDLNGDPYGMVRVEADAPGSLVPTDTNLVIDLFGAQPTAARFTGTDWSGIFTVTSLSPFAVTLDGVAAGGGRNLTIRATGTATQ